MSDKDRSSPTLVENSLKSLLDQPSIFPLIDITFSQKKRKKKGVETGNDADDQIISPEIISYVPPSCYPQARDHSSSFAFF
ncbi:hypothetical protein DMN91_005827 [Ooceraea biroi]|uniref:Uncharacterized protein n=1 Tax=Ooceraea biroi TaxID=2015173 RepID=A0A3L8DLZ6_OOCBI|nr:hypothetical protein DMN91_005827 [Ooceraea biroi]